MNHNSLDNEEDEKYFDEIERANFIKVINSFKNYRKHNYHRIEQRLIYISQLPLRQQQLLEKYKKTLNSTKQCIDQNNLLIDKFLAGTNELFVNAAVNEIHGEDISKNGEQLTFFDSESDRVIVTLKQIVRDWTDLGASEREESYKPILDALSENFDITTMEKNQYRVLVPGAGLARLVYEISTLGLYCEGNEFSLFMLIVSNFLLNRCLFDSQYELFPFCHNFMNNLNRNDPLLSCRFPDVSPFQNPPKGEMNMIAGDFLQVYGQPAQYDQWDAVTTCFFLDCANNVVDFIEIIHKILKKGGIWINLGPLLYHYCDMNNELSLEPSYEDIREIIEKTGFEYLKENKNCRTRYSQNELSMAKLEYRSVFFVVRKK
ncbi:hypothetical protein PVAND_001283 [Polypedilum vanderplanki]|uniref:carnosine N-methyltransferase n=1 Tax=Polypedilum vanderplanki TaxID=319348 RepID=A0A9J6BMX5_POLVA|nr:hypothetical protein PVAND_001283 [Polypedilum vanderplanki]